MMSNSASCSAVPICMRTVMPGPPGGDHARGRGRGRYYAEFGIPAGESVQDRGPPGRYIARVNGTLVTNPVIAIDSHTAGEPTRTVISGGPDLGDGPLAERRERFRSDCDRFRSAVVCEPRGSDVLVGALVVRPTDPLCTAGVIFF